MSEDIAERMSRLQADLREKAAWHRRTQQVTDPDSAPVEEPAEDVEAAVPGPADQSARGDGISGGGLPAAIADAEAIGDHAEAGRLKAQLHHELAEAERRRELHLPPENPNA